MLVGRALLLVLQLGCSWAKAICWVRVDEAMRLGHIGAGPVLLLGSSACFFVDHWLAKDGLRIGLPLD